MTRSAQQEKAARRDVVPAAGTARPMPGEVYAQSRFLILFGLALLALGSVALLLCKLPLPEITQTLAALAGGGLILLGNGMMIYGLLIYAGWRQE